ncbi:hypothetical protein GGF46_003137 [Coemansia sp. RSA 552]|nr:hypothetical protein GGF46_003137 [Coemansia sp. RSA 552]
MAGEETITMTLVQAQEKQQPPAVLSVKAHSDDMPSPATEGTVGGEAVCVERNNNEYMLVYRAIEALKSQLQRAESDMGILQGLRDQALADPLGYVESLVGGTAPKAPSPQTVVQVPLVNAEPYLYHASEAAASKYTRIAQSQTAGAGTGPSLSVRVPHARRAAMYASAKLGKRRISARQPFTATGAGQLTGITAVATPEYSPPTAMRPAEPTSGLHGKGSSGPAAAPQAMRANTEPLRVPLVFSAPSAVTTQPGTPTQRGKSQKMLTPQMMAEFRRQASEEPLASTVAQRTETRRSEEDDDDDEYYNRLVQSASTNSQYSGKALLFSGVSASPGEPVKRKRGRPRKNPLGTPPPARPPKLPKKPRAPKSAGGQEKGDSKPASYNVPWSDGEQELLERLLLEYPDEEVANNRWRKISEAMGTRTMRQVASRVQKYFLKLAKAGLPVPGRVPDTTNWSSWAPRIPEPTPKRRGPGRPPGSGRGKRKDAVDFTSSEEDEEASINEDAMMDLDREGTNSPPPTMAFDRKGKQADRSSDVFVGTDELSLAGLEDNSWAVPADPMGASTSAAAQRPQVQSSALRSAKAVHLGYRCSSCLAEPIVGIRWQCTDCQSTAQPVDLCDECREDGLFETEEHNEAHSFVAWREAEMEPYYANEVAAPALREYSYLA